MYRISWLDTMYMYLVKMAWIYLRINYLGHLNDRKCNQSFIVLKTRFSTTRVDWHFPTSSPCSPTWAYLVPIGVGFTPPSAPSGAACAGGSNASAWRHCVKCSWCTMSEALAMRASRVGRWLCTLLSTQATLDVPSLNRYFHSRHVTFSSRAAISSSIRTRNAGT